MPKSVKVNDLKRSDALLLVTVVKALDSGFVNKDLSKEHFSNLIGRFAKYDVYDELTFILNYSMVQLLFQQYSDVSYSRKKAIIDHVFSSLLKINSTCLARGSFVGVIYDDKYNLSKSLLSHEGLETFFKDSDILNVMNKRSLLGCFSFFPDILEANNMCVKSFFNYLSTVVLNSTDEQFKFDFSKDYIYQILGMRSASGDNSIDVFMQAAEFGYYPEFTKRFLSSVLDFCKNFNNLEQEVLTHFCLRGFSALSRSIYFINYDFIKLLHSFDVRVLSESQMMPGSGGEEGRIDATTAWCASLIYFLKVDCKKTDTGDVWEFSPVHELKLKRLGSVLRLLLKQQQSEEQTLFMDKVKETLCGSLICSDSMILNALLEGFLVYNDNCNNSAAYRRAYLFDQIIGLGLAGAEHPTLDVLLVKYRSLLDGNLQQSILLACKKDMVSAVMKDDVELLSKALIRYGEQNRLFNSPGSMEQRADSESREATVEQDGEGEDNVDIFSVNIAPALYSVSLGIDSESLLGLVCWLKSVECFSFLLKRFKATDRQEILINKVFSERPLIFWCEDFNYLNVFFPSHAESDDAHDRLRACKALFISSTKSPKKRARKTLDKGVDKGEKAEKRSVANRPSPTKRIKKSVLPVQSSSAVSLDSPIAALKRFGTFVEAKERDSHSEVTNSNQFARLDTNTFPDYLQHLIKVKSSIV
jgi:hypothetical protein